MINRQTPTLEVLDLAVPHARDGCDEDVGSRPKRRQLHSERARIKPVPPGSRRPVPSADSCQRLGEATPDGSTTTDEVTGVGVRRFHRAGLPLAEGVLRKAELEREKPPVRFVRWPEPCRRVQRNDGRPVQSPGLQHRRCGVARRCPLLEPLPFTACVEDVIREGVEVGPRSAQEGPEHVPRDEWPGAGIRLSVADRLRQRLAVEGISAKPTVGKQLAVDVERPNCAGALQPRLVRGRLCVSRQLHERKPISPAPQPKRSEVVLLRPPGEGAQDACELHDGRDVRASYGRPVDVGAAKDRVVWVELRHEDGAGDRRPCRRWEPRELHDLRRGRDVHRPIGGREVPHVVGEGEDHCAVDQRVLLEDRLVWPERREPVVRTAVKERRHR